MDSQVNQVDELGNVVPLGTFPVSIFKPAYSADRKTHIYSRATNLSNSDQVSYNDLTFGTYIHYLPSPNGGQGLMDQTSYATQTDVKISRSLVVATYSPY